jgi:Tfp pilus assembly protein PilF
VSDLKLEKERLQSLVALTPMDASRRLALAHVYRDLAMLPEAQREYRKVLALQPESATVRADYQEFLRHARTLMDARMDFGTAPVP